MKIFANVRVSTDFAVLGTEVRGGSSPTLTTAGFSVRYDASTGLYVMDFPTTAPGGFHEYASNTPNARTWGGTLVPGQELGVDVRKPTNPDLPLSYTTLASYNAYTFGPDPFGWLAFGSATPAGGMPVTGTAAYSAEVRGMTLDRTGGIVGTAALQFDFGAGNLSGQFDPTLLNWDGTFSLGRYDFVNTIYSSGSTTFSGQLSKSGFAQNGSFNGQFTGPNAQELMARWTAPYQDPTTLQNSTIFGVWVGKH